MICISQHSLLLSSALKWDSLEVTQNLSQDGGQIRSCQMVSGPDKQYSLIQCHGENPAQVKIERDVESATNTLSELQILMHVRMLEMLLAFKAYHRATKRRIS